MPENNFYFETGKKFLGEMTDDLLVKKIEECNLVINELTTSPAWTIVLFDAQDLMKRLDNTWQDFPSDSEQLKEMRVLKMAVKHIISLPIKYAQDLDMVQRELLHRQHPDEIISKDVDNE